MQQRRSRKNILHPILDGIVNEEYCPLRFHHKSNSSNFLGGAQPWKEWFFSITEEHKAFSRPFIQELLCNKAIDGAFFGRKKSHPTPFAILSKIWYNASLLDLSVRLTFNP
jgi:hypothetical protein